MTTNKTPAKLGIMFQSRTKELPLKSRLLETALRAVERKAQVGNAEQDNGFYHAARIVHILQEQFPKQHSDSAIQETNCPLHILFADKATQNIATLLALLHNLIDEKHYKRIVQEDEYPDSIKIPNPESRAQTILQKFITQGPALPIEQINELLAALDIVEDKAEQIRKEHIDSTTAPQEPYFLEIPMTELGIIRDLVQKHGPLPLLIKAIELIDNLEYPLPPEGNELVNSRMQQDAVEALYFYLPFLEIIGAYQLHRRLKNLALSTYTLT